MLETRAAWWRSAAWVRVAAAAGVTLALVAGIVGASTKSFPRDDTPEGAYMRVALAVRNGSPRDMFAYLEDEAQWASFSVAERRAAARALVLESYPPGARAGALAGLGHADAADGPGAFAWLYGEKGWAARLRQDMSGVARVESLGDRATVVTARGTRWPFRRRQNGIWGLTVFTAELVAEREKADRDLGVVRASAADYAGARDARAPD